MNPHDSTFSSTLASLPLGFWVAVGVWSLAAYLSVMRIRQAIGLPMLAVLGTVAGWYFGDAFYNEYAGYLRTFEPWIMNQAWGQVALFTGMFAVLTPVCHHYLNRRLEKQESHIFGLVQQGIDNENFQQKLTIIFWSVFTVWLILTVVAFLKLGMDIRYYFFPFLGEKAEPWSRSRIGKGLDALIALAGYLQVFTASAFGVLGALSNKKTIRVAALCGCILTWPYYIFDRTRNAILAATIPGILSWTFFRFRGKILWKFAVLFLWFVVVEAWLRFVIQNRTEMTISDAFQEQGFSLQEKDKNTAHHEGLNMFEELCWMDTFIYSHTMKPDWGKRYFAEMVNPIPRVLWPGKPMIGIDYAVARGMGGGQDEDAGVFASISTGMIGQGVQNFDLWMGPAAAAFLMAIWASALARLDLEEHKTGATMLYIIGGVLTFNMGRDITLITLYPFLFGWLLIWWLNRKKAGAPVNERAVARSIRAGGRPVKSVVRGKPVPAVRNKPRQRFL